MDSYLNKRCRAHLRPTNDSWRVDETYIEAECRRENLPPPNLLVKGQPKYLYRAVDSSGQTLDFLLSAKRNAQAAKRFFRRAMNAVHNQEPRVINVDKNAAYPKAIEELKEKKSCPSRWS